MTTSRLSSVEGMASLLQYIRDELREGRDLSLPHEDAQKLMATFYEYRNRANAPDALSQALNEGDGAYRP